MFLAEQPYLRLAKVFFSMTEPPPDNLPAAIRNPMKGSWLPDPRDSWLLIVLSRFVQRQCWAKEMLLRQLPDRMPISRDGKGLPEGMPIPGMPDWVIGEYFGPDWGAIHNTVSREWIPVSTSCGDATENVVLPGHFWAMLLRQPPGSPERYLLDSDTEEMKCFDSLAEAGLLRPTDSFGDNWKRRQKPEAYAITPKFLYITMFAPNFHRLWEDPKHRMWLAALIGDWPTVQRLADAADDECVERAAAERAAEQRRQQLNKGCDLEYENPADENPDAPFILHFAREVMESGLAGALKLSGIAVEDGSVSEEFGKVLDKINEPWWLPCLYQLFTAICAQPPAAQRGSFAIQCALSLIREGYRRAEVLQALEMFDEQILTILLIYLNRAPEKVIPLIRRFLRQDVMKSAWPGQCSEELQSEYHASCLIAVAILSWVDQPWSRLELQEAIQDRWEVNQNPADIAPLAMALAESDDFKTREFAAPWLARVGPKTRKATAADLQDARSEIDTLLACGGEDLLVLDKKLGKPPQLRT